MGMGLITGPYGTCCACCNPPETLTGTFTFPVGHAAEVINGKTVTFERDCDQPLVTTHTLLECCRWDGNFVACADCIHTVYIYCATVLADPEDPDSGEVRWVMEYVYTGQVFTTTNFSCVEPGTPSASGLVVTGGTGRTFFWADWDLTTLDLTDADCNDEECCEDPDLPDTIEVRWYLPGCALDGTGTTLTKSCCVKDLACGISGSVLDAECTWYGSQDIRGLCLDGAEELQYNLWCDAGTIKVYYVCLDDYGNSTTCLDHVLSSGTLSTTDYTCDPFEFFIPGTAGSAGPGCCGTGCNGGICVTPDGSACPPPGIELPCCEPDVIPTTLTATIELVSGMCACTDATVELTYDADTTWSDYGHWTGTGDFCGEDMTILIYCQNMGGSCGSFFMNIGCPTEETNGISAEFGCVCDPFEVVFLWSLSANCCALGGDITVTVTA